MMQSNLINDLLISRRKALQALGGLSAVLATPAGVLAASQAPADMKNGLNYQDPLDNLYAFGKIWAGYDQPVYGAYHGIMYARVDGKVNTPLFGYVGTGVLQGRIETDGSLSLRGRETGFFTDLAMTRILESWDNPYTGEKNIPFNFLNDIGGKLDQEMPRYAFGTPDDKPTLMNSGTHVEKDGKVPFILPFETYGDDLLMAWDYAHDYTNPVTPDKWPKASTGPRITPSEHFTFRVSKREMEDRSVPTCRSMAGFTRVSDWWPWMRMGGNRYQNGALIGRMYSHKGLPGYQDIPRYLLDYVEKHHAKYLEVPEVWSSTGPRGTWEKYAEAVPPEVG